MITESGDWLIVGESFVHLAERTQLHRTKQLEDSIAQDSGRRIGEPVCQDQTVKVVALGLPHRGWSSSPSSPAPYGPGNVAVIQTAVGVSGT